MVIMSMIECTLLPTIRKITIKITIRYYFTAFIKIIIKKENNECWRGGKERQIHILMGAWC